MHALKLLKKDHMNVLSLFEQFERDRASLDRRDEVFAQIRRELQLHSKVEEEIFYPMVKALNGTGPDLVSEAIRQHKDIDQMLTEISRLKPNDKSYDERVEILFENVEHHVDEEEGEIFQFAEENSSPEQLEDLGRQVEDRKRILDQRMAA